MENNQLLYIQDPLKLEFQATILREIQLPDGRIGVILDSTYFYPTGGGQEHDTGTIGNAKVIDVYKEVEPPTLIHVVDRHIQPGAVTARIDRDRRLRHMQHHTAQHLLTQCFVRLFEKETVSANINGSTPSTLDLVAESISRPELEQVEALANAIVFENRQVKSYFVTPAEIARLPLRRPPSVSENVRIVEIDSYDYSACGGTHCPNTSMIGLVKILKTERQNEKLRVHFVAGQQALEYFRTYQDIVTGLAAHLSVHPQELIQVFERQADQLKTAQKELQALRLEKIGLEADRLAQNAETIGEQRIVLASFRHRPLAELRALADELRGMPSLVAMLANYDGQKLSLVVACSEDAPVSAQDILKRKLQPIAGRGGGDQYIAQGGASASETQFHAFFDDNVALIQECLQANSSLSGQQ